MAAPAFRAAAVSIGNIASLYKQAKAVNELTGDAYSAVGYLRKRVADQISSSTEPEEFTPPTNKRHSSSELGNVHVAYSTGSTKRRETTPPYRVNYPVAQNNIPYTRWRLLGFGARSSAPRRGRKLRSRKRYARRSAKWRRRRY